MVESMVWWFIATFCAFFVKGLCGFANTLVFTSILSFGNDNRNISPVELMLGYPTNIILAVKERKSIDWKMSLPLAGLILAGSIPGIIFLKNADTSLIKVVFGVVIIIIGIEMLIREFYPSKMKESKIILLIIGILSGVLCGLYGVGALLGAYLGRVTKDSSSFKANICMIFVIENTFRIILYSVWGIITLETLKQAVYLMPVMLISLCAGMYVGKILDDKWIKRLVIILLIISGVALIINSR